jgi:hypothetical protein
MAEAPNVASVLAAATEARRKFLAFDVEYKVDIHLFTTSQQLLSPLT